MLPMANFPTLPKLGMEPVGPVMPVGPVYPVGPVAPGDDAVQAGPVVPV